MDFYPALAILITLREGCGAWVTKGGLCVCTHLHFSGKKSKQYDPVDFTTLNARTVLCVTSQGFTPTQNIHE